MKDSLLAWAAEHVSPIVAAAAFGELHHINGQHAQSFACFEHLGSLAGEADTDVHSRALQGIANAQIATGNNVGARKTYQGIQVAGVISRDLQLQVHALTGLSGLFDQEGRLDRAITLLKKAKSIAVGDARALEGVKIALGDVYNAQSSLELALIQFQGVEALIRQQGRKRHLPAVLHQLGAIHSRWGEHTEALNYFEEERYLIDALGDRVQLGYCLRELAVIELAASNTYKAIELLSQAETIDVQRSDKQLEAVVHADFGAAFTFRQSVVPASEHFARAGALWRQTGDEKNPARPWPHVKPACLHERAQVPRKRGLCVCGRVRGETLQHRCRRFEPTRSTAPMPRLPSSPTCRVACSLPVPLANGVTIARRPCLTPLSQSLVSRISTPSDVI